MQENKQRTYSLRHSTKHNSFFYEEIYLDGETLLQYEGVLEYGYNSNVQHDQIEVAVRMLKCLMKGFSIIIAYQSHPNIFHKVFSKTCSFYPL